APAQGFHLTVKTLERRDRRPRCAGAFGGLLLIGVIFLTGALPSPTGQAPWGPLSCTQPGRSGSAPAQGFHLAVKTLERRARRPRDAGAFGGLLLIGMIFLASTFRPLEAAAAGTGVVAADLDALVDGGLLLDGAVAATGGAGDLGHPLALHGALAVLGL